jgi:hypothetical protein
MGNVTATSEPVTGSGEAAARIADALQAEYFRGVLADHRAHLGATLAKVRMQIDNHREADDRVEVHRLQRQFREHEDELGQLNWLIDGLERRYTETWADLDSELR